mgnify:FL=1
MSFTQSLPGPDHGILHNGHKEFSYLELQDGLRYQHDGSAGDDDFALIQASDQSGLQNVLLPINVKVGTFSIVSTYWHILPE